MKRWMLFLIVLAILFSGREAHAATPINNSVGSAIGHNFTSSEEDSESNVSFIDMERLAIFNFTNSTKKPINFKGAEYNLVSSKGKIYPLEVNSVRNDNYDDEFLCNPGEGIAIYARTSRKVVLSSDKTKSKKYVEGFFIETANGERFFFE